MCFDLLGEPGWNPSRCSSSNYADYNFDVRDSNLRNAWNLGLNIMICQTKPPIVT